MSYDTKIASARSVIEEHNKISDKTINFDSFLSKLQELGGTTSETLSDCSWEDLENAGLPRLLARRVSKIFRQENEEEKTTSAYVSPKKLAQLSVPELLERYNPLDMDSPVANRLKSISNNKKCIVFNNDGTVNIIYSKILINDIQLGLPERDVFFDNGDPKNTYRIGERVNVFANENPLFPGKPLTSDECCYNTNLSWLGIDQKTRQIVYLAVKETKELVIKNSQDAYSVFGLIKGGNLSNIAPKAVLKLNELEKLGQTPPLKISVVNNVIPNDPFFKHREY